MTESFRRFAENQVSGSADHRKSTGKMSVHSRVTNTSSASLDSGRFRLSTRQAAILQELDRLNKDEQMMVLRDAIGHKLSAAEQISLLRDTLRFAEHRANLTRLRPSAIPTATNGRYQFPQSAHIPPQLHCVQPPSCSASISHVLVGLPPPPPPFPVESYAFAPLP